MIQFDELQIKNSKGSDKNKVFEASEMSLDELTSTLFQPVVRYCQGDEMLKNFAAEPHLDKENKARFLAQNGKTWPFLAFPQCRNLPKEHHFSGRFLIFSGKLGGLFLHFNHTYIPHFRKIEVIFHVD